MGEKEEAEKQLASVEAEGEVLKSKLAVSTRLRAGDAKAVVPNV